MTAAFALAFSICPAVPGVIQPPQEKPITTAAIPPQTVPHIPGFTHSGIFIVEPLIITDY
jgi:hypothetical protein